VKCNGEQQGASSHWKRQAERQGVPNQKGEKSVGEGKMEEPRRNVLSILLKDGSAAGKAQFPANRRKEV